MATYLLQHVVKETKPCLYVAFPRAIKVQTHCYIRLFGGAYHLCHALPSEQQLCYLFPVHTHFTEYKGLTTEIFCKLRIRFAVSYDVGTCEVVLWIVNVFCQHTRPWFTARMVISREMTVY